MAEDGIWARGTGSYRVLRTLWTQTAQPEHCAPLATCYLLLATCYLLRDNKLDCPERRSAAAVKTGKDGDFEHVLWPPRYCACSLLSGRPMLHAHGRQR